MKYFFYQHKNGEALIAAVIGFLLILLCTSYTGIGVSPDSVVYTSVARNLHAGKGLKEFSSLPIVQFPVFFPAFLGFVYTVSGVDPIAIAPYLNGILFATVIFCCGLLIDQFPLKNSWYKRFMLLLIALSPSLLEIYKMIWSETLFILLSVIFMLRWKSYNQNHQLKHLIIFALIAAIAVITRYAGITLIFTGCLLLLIDQTLPILKKIRHFLIFGFLSVSLLAINLIRNAIILGTATGNRQSGNTPFTENLQYFGTTISGWLSVPEDFLRIAFLIGIISLIGFGILFAFRLKKSTQNPTELILISFFLIYASFILITSTISRYETINNRLLAPAFIPFLLGGTSWLLPTLRKYPQKQYAIFALFFGSIFLWRSFQFDYQQYEYDMTYGIPGYTDDTWNKSEVVIFLKKHPQIFNSAAVYANDSAAMYFITGLKCFSIPDRHYPKETQEYHRPKHRFVVWFDQVEDEELLSLTELKNVKPLRLVFHFKDGSIYETY